MAKKSVVITESPDVQAPTEVETVTCPVDGNQKPSDAPCQVCGN